eukprot:CAMPEP_0184696964 /NCGR_PEP_ID=MMETSP0313-20130426/4113_1 /TAXON_ID=2792 /ORGANISM="Porphyridium aerugineum, Strain SAG 1380-2" /LENGTH=94 /DNA_ID=CAMNT_0027155723 /DNA_START=358 /DNA_END=639 /DNA_ORIENTATION=+
MARTLPPESDLALSMISSSSSGDFVVSSSDFLYTFSPMVGKNSGRELFRTRCNRSVLNNHVYLVSHHEHSKLHFPKRTNIEGRPANGPSPCMDV